MQNRVQLPDILIFHPRFFEHIFYMFKKLGVGGLVEPGPAAPEPVRLVGFVAFGGGELAFKLGDEFAAHRIGVARFDHPLLLDELRVLFSDEDEAFLFKS